MSVENLDSTDWLDAELRRVPVPEGLVPKLREVAADEVFVDQSDERLNARLGEVALPTDLLAGLTRTIADAQLDERVADVAVPAGLVHRLQQVIDDAVLDEHVADVPSPHGFVSRLRSAVSPGPLRRLALAASLLIVVGVGYGAADWLRTTFWSHSVRDNGLADANLVEPEVEIDLDAFADDIGGLTADDLELLPTTESPLDPEDDGTDDAVAMIESIPGHETAPSVDDEISRVLANRKDRQLGDPLATNWQPPDRIVGFTVEAEKIPSFQAVLPRPAVGVAPPLDSGYDRTALARSGVHPFVEPGRNDLLRVSVAPLTTATDSFDLLQDRLSQRGRTRDVVIRPEDFLAAMSYEFPSAAAGQLALRTAAGPAPLSRDGVGLIQIGVQAGPPVVSSRRPVHLTIAVDTSAAMQWHGRLSIVRESLRKLVADLQPDDRVSLVAFGDSADVLARDLGPADAAALRTAMGWLAPEGAANLVAGLRAACGVAVEGQAVSSARRCLVVMSDSIGNLPESQIGAMEQMIARVADKKVAGGEIEWLFIEVSGPGSESGDLTLSRLASWAGGRLRNAHGRRDLEMHLAEILSGRSNIVARGAELRVMFNPQAVAQYRLVGHEPSRATSWSKDSASTADLSAGQSATALYQVVLHDNNVNDVATAEVIWRDAATGKTHRVTQRISRLQFATSFLDSAMSLQAAALAAETAEILRGSPYSPRGTHTLDRVVALAAHANPRLREQREFKRLLRLAEMARQAGLDR
jgi:Ca-activated chloride channel family protein